MNHQLIIDTDSGIDDAIAILVAISPLSDFDLRAIITVAGNVPINLAHANARKICELAGRLDVPVYAGSSRPMRRSLPKGANIHGPHGFGNVLLPEPTAVVTDENGVEFLIRTLGAGNDSSITIAALGPLTNLGTAFVRAPDIVRSVREVVMMGGAFSVPGNITAWAEYNVYADPEAAAVVLNSGVPITMVPLDVTNSAIISKECIARLSRLHSRCGKVAAEMLSYYEQSYAKLSGEGAPLHDPCVIAYLARPQMFTGRVSNVYIDTIDGANLGKTTAADEERPSSGSPGRVQYLTHVDVETYFGFLSDGLARLP